MKETKVKEKIIGAAYICIEKYGIQATTIRKIAKEAGVNVAAVNYYFKSKQKLIEEVEKSSMRSAFTDWDEVTQDGNGFIEKIELFLLHWLDGMYNYPNFTRSHVYEALVNNNYKGIFIKGLNKFLYEMEKISKQYGITGSDNEIKFIIMQLFTMTTFTGVFPGLFQSYSGLDLKDRKIIKEYMGFFIRKILADNIK